MELTARAKAWVAIYKKRTRSEPTEEQIRFIALIEKTCDALKRSGERDSLNGREPRPIATREILTSINKNSPTGFSGRVARKELAKVFRKSYMDGYKKHTANSLEVHNEK